MEGKDSTKEKCIEHSIVYQAIYEEHNALVARICGLFEAVLSNDNQLKAAKRTAKDILRDEQDRMCDYLYSKAYPDEKIVPSEYHRMKIITQNPN